MNQKNAVGIVVIVACVALALYFLKDSFLYYSTSGDARKEFVAKNPTIYKRIFNLGLDLQGGMRMVLEIDRSKLTPEASKDVLDRAYTILENRINGLGVAEPTLQKQGTERLIVELPGLRDEAQARQVIGSTAQLEFKLLREPTELARAIGVIDNALKGIKDTTNIDSVKADSAKIAAESKQAAAKQLFQGDEDKSADSLKDTSAVAAAKITSFSSLLMSMGDQVGVLEENKESVNKILARADVISALDRAGLGGNQFLWAHKVEQSAATRYRFIYYVKGRAEMKGDMIADARMSLQSGGMTGGPVVELEMNRKGAGQFARVTGMNVNKYLAIVLDNTVYSAPTIRAKISGGNAQIEGKFTTEEAKNLAVVLRAGALPAPVTIIEQQAVGPSLGQDSIKMGINAGIIGLTLILMFIIFYYRLSGVYACLALVLNLLFVLAIMAGINQTLTLPGICGLVLNLGMAIDANVLIMERIREELRIGKTVRSAIETGYSRAFLVIFDANLTTLITAFILLWLGTGPIKGFAITLIIGLILSMFTALYVSHVMYRIGVSPSTTKLSI